MPLRIIIANRLFRIPGVLSKIIGYIFHFIFPKKRFTIPKQSDALFKSSKKTKIPKILWQTNYSNIVSLPIYLNYLCNRVMSYDYEYRYAGNEDCYEFIKVNGTEEVLNAFNKLSDGAAKADFWRIFVLNEIGGVYLDMDGHFVWPLNKIIKENDLDVYVIPRRDEYTNYFIASVKNNIILKDTLDIIVHNINNIDNMKDEDKTVFILTGPSTLIKAIGEKEVNARSYKITCIQGNFTNEYFQYIDKKQGKWTHTKKDEILKKD